MVGSYIIGVKHSYAQESVVGRVLSFFLQLIISVLYVFYCHSLSATSGFGLDRKVRCWRNTKVPSSNIFEDRLKRKI